MYQKLIVRRGQLVGPISDLSLNVIAEIKAPRGRRRFIVLYKKVYGNKLDIENVGATDHGNNFKQSYLTLGTTVVGSMLDVSSKWCTVTSLSVSYMPPQDTLHEFECPVEGVSGGLLIYRDGRGSFSAVLGNLPDSPLLIRDEKDLL